MSEGMPKPSATLPTVVPPGPQALKGISRFSHDAMATTFEVLILGQEPEYARQAADEAFREADRLEEQLSRFVPWSDVSQVNALGAVQPVLVGAALLDCLQLAPEVNRDTAGAFDVTVGALLACRRGADGREREPSEEELARARACTGMGLLEVDRPQRAVWLKVPGVKLDLGAVGKGYALDRMAELLRAWSIDCALLHSGQSSALGLGAPPGLPGWPLALRNPADQNRTVGEVILRDRAVSGSGMVLHGRHIVDPRTGSLAEGNAASWAVAESAALSDALSTAFLVMRASEVELYCVQHAGVGGMLLPSGLAKPEVSRWGRWEP